MIYAQLRQPLTRFAASLVGPHGADDLVSEVVVSTLRKRQLASLDDPKAYLMQAVVNRAASWSRKSITNRARQAALVAQYEPSREHFVDVRPEVIRTVESLPTRQRAAVYLVYWEDLAPIEAARLMGVRPGTLRRYLHLARRQLRRHLDEG